MLSSISFFLRAKSVSSISPLLRSELSFESRSSIAPMNVACETRSIELAPAQAAFMSFINAFPACSPRFSCFGRLVFVHRAPASADRLPQLPCLFQKPPASPSVPLRIHGTGRLSRLSLGAGGVLPRFPVENKRRLPRSPFRCPAIRHCSLSQ